MASSTPSGPTGAAVLRSHCPSPPFMVSKDISSTARRDLRRVERLAERLAERGAEERLAERLAERL